MDPCKHNAAERSRSAALLYACQTNSDVRTSKPVHVAVLLWPYVTAAQLRFDQMERCMIALMRVLAFQLQ